MAMLKIFAYAKAILSAFMLLVISSHSAADALNEMQRISHFSIDRTEVSIGQFARFADAAKM
jgi:hypothetical protein